jgi:general secretion pathway protein K
MRSERGFALFVAMWLLAVIAALGLSVGHEGRGRALAAANRSEGAIALAAAHAGIAHARVRLARGLDEAERSRGATWRRDPWGSLDTLLAEPQRLGEASYEVRFRDAGAALNLNRATDRDLHTLLLALRMDAVQAATVADAILDWRDADDAPRVRGAERAQYLQRGHLVLPANRPFREVAEIRHVLGMTPEIYERLRPHLTVHGSGRININAAAAPVLYTLPGITDAVVAAVIQRREGGRPVASFHELVTTVSGRARSVLISNLQRLYDRATFVTEEIEVVSMGLGPGGLAHARVEAVLVPSGTAVAVRRVARQ